METEKKNETCSKVMDLYLGLDKNERIPFPVTFHLLTCSKCRRQVQLLKTAEKLSASPLAISTPLSDGQIESLIRKIDANYDIPQMKNPIAMHKWIIAGIVMILLMLVFGVFTDESTNSSLLTAFYIVFACIVTTYTAMFVGTNMDFFVKKIDTHKTAM